MTKIGAATLKEGGDRILANAEYATFMALELEALRPPPKPLPDLSHLTEKQKQEYYFSMQPESTKAAMIRQKDRDPKDDWDYVLRAMPNCVANPEAETKEELIGMRSISPSEYGLIEGMRRGAKNTLGDSKNSSLTQESRERAVNAYTYSKPAVLTQSDLKSIKKVEELKSIPRVEAAEVKQQKKESWFFRTYMYLRSLIDLGG